MVTYSWQAGRATLLADSHPGPARLLATALGPSRPLPIGREKNPRIDPETMTVLPHHVCGKNPRNDQEIMTMLA